MNKIKVGVSSCLLGQKVRHDGGHKRNKLIVDMLADYFEFSAFCPELATGLSVPRPTLRLVRQDSAIRMLGTKDPHMDVTDRMQKTAENTLGDMDDLCGYILKKDSPSCGMERVRIYNSKGQAERNGRGLFADTLMKHHPNLPVEEEGRLMDPVLRENFIERVFVYHRWQQLTQSDLSVAVLIEFHSRHKFNLLAHSEVALRQLGNLVANASNEDIQQVAETYIATLMQAMKKPASRKSHTNVLMHVMGFLKKALTPVEKHEINEILKQYRLGFIPLVVPVTLLNHYFRKAQVPYIEKQHYMNPYPVEMMLRNQV